MVRIVYDDLIRWSSRGETCKRSNSNVESKIQGLKRRKEKRDGDARGGAELRRSQRAYKGHINRGLARESPTNPWTKSFT